MNHLLNKFPFSLLDNQRKPRFCTIQIQIVQHTGIFVNRDHIPRRYHLLIVGFIHLNRKLSDFPIVSPGCTSVSDSFAEFLSFPLRYVDRIVLLIDKVEILGNGFKGEAASTNSPTQGSHRIGLIQIVPTQRTPRLKVVLHGHGISGVIPF